MATDPQNEGTDAAGTPADLPGIVDWLELFAGQSEIWIDHEGLRVTHRGRFDLAEVIVVNAN